MNADRDQIGIFQKMRIKNLRRGKKLDFFTLEMSKNDLIRNFLRNGRVRVNDKKSSFDILN